ncbi:HET domain-containing protein [Fusarium sp. Ph1]|nr:HET domain-containing protein [Fusarium sp. Ph1]
MTLTHRWGPDPVDHIVLTKDTYPQLVEGVPLSVLPQVFQDAIYICRHLEVGYIWIDSLCIFQVKDNTQDWQHEASLMKDVYSNSFCNISAADAPDPSHSIFNHRDPRTLIPQVVAKSGKDAAKTPERFILSDYRIWQTEVSNALVNKRAWVLQERFLAPRILHFGKRQLIWECCEKDAAEVYPDGLPPSLSTSSDAAFKQLNSSDYISRVGRYKNRKDDGNSAPHLSWLRIVELYTDSELTVPSDKLIACSGIVKRMAEVVQDDYVAGMWRRYLEGELLWAAHGNHRPKEYRAPTWSWASIEGPVTPGEPRIQDSLITVQDYHLDYWTDDQTAAIRGGWLRLRGVLRKVTLEYRVGEGRYWDMLLDGEKVHTQEETSPADSEPRVMLDILHEDFDQENAQGLLFCMCARSKNEDGRSMYILLLKMVQGETGTFQRIGLAYAWSAKVKERALMRSPGEAQLPCLEYRDGMHSICII